MTADRTSGVIAVPTSNDNLSLLTGTFPAPPDTPYEGGVYDIEIRIPNEYPFKSPMMRFKTKIWHPNVSSQTGAICLDTLSTAWSPVQTIKTALLSLRMLLEFPNPKDPQDHEVAKMMLADPEACARKAQAWAIQYAGAPPKTLDFSKYKTEAQLLETNPLDDVARYGGYNRELVQRFTTMGFDVEHVVDVLRSLHIPTMNGRDWMLDEGHIADITTRLLGD